MGFFDRLRNQTPDEAEGGPASITPHDLERLDRAAREERAPWDRLPNETGPEFALFSAYLAESSDNVSAFARSVHDRTPQAVQSLASRRRWRARKAALQVYLARERLEAATGAARDEGAAWGAIVTEATGWVLDSILIHKAEGKPLAPADIRAMLKPLHDIRQLIAGAPTEIRENRFANADAEKLKKIEALLDNEADPETNPTEH